MTDEQQLRRFRDALEQSANPMSRGGAGAVTIVLSLEMAPAATIAEYFDEFARLWREIRLEAQLT